MRIRIDVPDDQAVELRRLAERERTSVDDVIRQAISQFLGRRRDPIRAAFGLWRDRDEDGLTIEGRLREEWGD